MEKLVAALEAEESLDRSQIEAALGPAPPRKQREQASALKETAPLRPIGAPRDDESRTGTA